MPWMNQDVNDETGAWIGNGLEWCGKASIRLEIK